MTGGPRWIHFCCAGIDQSSKDSGHLRGVCALLEAAKVIFQPSPAHHNVVSYVMLTARKRGVFDRTPTASCLFGWKRRISVDLGEGGSETNKIG